MSEFPKMTPQHLRRDAYVYVRQSTLSQVREHSESLERQYELAERAVALGWAAHQVVVIDDDLGRSGAETTAREGFRRLVADVGLGQVGLILGIEVSRLARNNADWYHLLDLCALTDTLIADGDGLYHPSDYNDRLVLGLKGTMSEAELHLIRNRLTAGLRHKAAKGELRQGSLVEDGLLIPRRPTRRGRVVWAPATYPAIHDFLTNPAYAGAFVFGRSKTDKRLDTAGRLVVRTRQVARGEWEVCIPDHHPGFITWESYETNQKLLRANWRPPRGHGGGAPREGSALLQGRLRCGRCGRMMQTGYSGTKGNCPRYVCGRAKQLYGTEHGCQSLGGRRLEAKVLEEVFAVLQPAALAATAKALAETETAHARRLVAFERAVERARFEADRARRQFDAVEPENRLVARTLERAWEQRLAEQRRAEADLAAQQARRPNPLTADELDWLSRAGADVRRIFEAPTTTARERKQLLRALVSEVVVTVNTEVRTADLRIIWEGGATTELTMELTKTGGHFHATDEDTVDLVRRLAVHYDDAKIALILSRQKRRTGTGLPFTQRRVASLRISRGIPAGPQVPVLPVRDDDDVVSIARAEQELGVCKVTIYRWLREGFVTGIQLTPGGPWHIRLDDELRAKVVPDVPDGWLSLDAAAKALGVARQTVLHRVQRGELDAVHVNRGKRKGLRIKVEQLGTGLFNTP